MNRPHANRRRHQAFTMVELLIVIGIITVLAGAALFGLSDMREAARKRRTRAEITRIHELIMERWQAYDGRSVRMSALTGVNRSPKAIATLRLVRLRELQRMELPDRREDLFNGPASLESTPALWNSYRRRVQAIHGTNWQTNWTAEHEGAECLYMIMAHIQTLDGSGLDYFANGDIGDVDGDQMPEILDGWGNPISFVRWAPGFRSPFQRGDLAPGVDDVAGLTEEDTTNDDYLDYLHADSRWEDGVTDNDPFKLMPLIISGGGDDQIGIVLRHSGTPTYPVNDPYYNVAPQLGAVAIAGTEEDDMTNHYSEQ